MSLLSTKFARRLGRANRRFRWVAAVLAAPVITLWILTVLIGAPAVYQAESQRLLPKYLANGLALADAGKSEELSAALQAEKPYFCLSARAVLPCIVRLRITVADERTGVSSNGYMFWFFGTQRWIHEKQLWTYERDGNDVHGWYDGGIYVGTVDDLDVEPGPP